MNLAAPFIHRPVATILLTIGVALSGIAAFLVLPVAPLPHFDSPTISVTANLPGGSPQTMSNSVATPLERRLGTIAALTEMTSSSRTGSSNVTLQFDLNRDIDGAARDVQAAINAARADLPTTLKANPVYRKVNPASAPIMILALTSNTRTPGQIYDAVANIVQQKLLEVSGVGDVELGGATLPAVRVEVQPFELTRLGISLEDVRAALSAANANRPKGVVEDAAQRFQIYTNDTGRTAADFRDLLIAWRNGAGVRLRDIATVSDGVEDLHNMGLFNGKPAVIILITRQPNANIIATVDEIKAVLPVLRAQLPGDVQLNIASDRTLSIRASLSEVEVTLAIALVLVVAVVSVFLAGQGATWIPAVAVVVSILGTLGVMYLCGFSLNNLSLMALTIATGLVVDDAIVVLENISRHLQSGLGRIEAALLGASEVAFTVLSISVSLVAVFIPLLFMGGVVGRLFREFAVTLSVAVLISLVISLSTTPVLCALLLKPGTPQAPSRLQRGVEHWFGRLSARYARALEWALAHPRLVIASLLLTVALNIMLFVIVPKGFFPIQDSGQLNGGLRADQSISFDAMQKKLRAIVNVIHQDPAVATVVGFTGGARSGGGFLFVTLKPEAITKQGSLTVMARLRPKLARITGVRVTLNPVQDLQTGARQSNATYQYTLKGDNMDELRNWAGKLADQLKQDPALMDVDTDLADHGLQSFVEIDRGSAARLGLNSTKVDNILYDAFGQRQVSTIYTSKNQYHVIMEVDPQYARTPAALNDVYVPSGKGQNNNNALANLIAVPNPASGTPVSTSATELVPLSALAHFVMNSSPVSINHQDASLSTTVTFNLAPGAALSDATAAIERANTALNMPVTIHGSMQGTARTFQESLRNEPVLIVAALVAIYLVLGMLYESYVHPLTVLSTLPSAGVGAVLALQLFKMDFSIIALIGLILLIGIIKKNAIMMIDFALEAQRGGLDAHQAIYAAALLRFRPIMMTTLAAGLGALPLAIGMGQGAELRQPLGITIIGGLLLSQVLTLLSTPVVYVLMDRLRRGRQPALQPIAPLPQLAGGLHVD